MLSPHYDRKPRREGRKSSLARSSRRQTGDRGALNLGSGRVCEVGEGKNKVVKKGISVLHIKTEAKSALIALSNATE